MSEDKEPSVLDYARYYGISKNYLQVHPLTHAPPPLDEAQSPLQLDTETPWLQWSPSIATTPPPERLTAVKEASKLLAATCVQHHDDSVFDAVDLNPTYRVRHLKLELPLLRSDHEMDMLNFVHRIEPDLSKEFIPFEKVDDEKDEGLGWPSYCLGWPEECFQKAQKERLEVPRDVFAYMSTALDARLKDGESGFEFDWPVARRNGARDPITPPLLPRSPSPQPFEPSSETGRLELLSEHSSPTRQELERIDKIIIQQDSVTPAAPRTDCATADPDKSDTNSIGDLYSPLKNIHIPPSPPQPERKRKRIQDSKVDGPLTPPPSHRPPPWAAAHGTSSLGEVLQCLNSPNNLSCPYPRRPEDTSLDDIDMLFAEHIAPLAAKATREIEQEQLQEADTTCRVLVPTMDFSRAKPPWDDRHGVSDTYTSGERHRQFLREIKKSYFAVVDTTPWRLLDGSLMRKLSWNPFVSHPQGRYQLQETIEDDGSLALFIAQPEPMDLDTLIWKPPGLRILDDVHDSEEEELAYGSFPPAKDVQSLIKKRNLELQHGEAMLAEMEISDPCENRQSSKNLGKVERVHLDKQEMAAAPDFSAMDALDEFLGLRTGKIKETSQKPKELPKIAAPKGTTMQSPIPLDASKDTAAKIPLPTPNPTIPTAETFIIASTTFLSNRYLTRQVQNFYPLLQIIERDFALHSSHAAALHQGLSSSTTKARRTHHHQETTSSDNEADLIISPSTGLILTSLPKIKQRALPGQPTQSPFRERVQKVATRYDRLIVMVSRAAISSDMDMDGESTMGGGELDESDCEALVSSTAFLNHLATLSESEVVFVDGGALVLAKWIVSLTVKFSSHTRLLEEETQWEVFLRHAGLNAFAAQAVLGEFKAIAEREGTWGLREFVLMSTEERCRQFEGATSALGGTRLLGRLGQVFAASWV
ncbi:MAG: hypothetical protein Q9168_002396 [Polycauliona sp. 1 TL-2023]